MPGTLKNKIRGHRLSWTMTVAAALACGIPGTVRAQSGGLDMDAPASKPVPQAVQSGGLDMDVNPAAPLATDAPKTAPHPDIQDGIRVAPAEAEQSPPIPPGGGSPIVSTNDLLAPSEPVSLVHPKVVTTAQLQKDQTSVSLFGIEGFGGDAAQGLQGFIGAAGDSVTCQAQGTTGFVCLLADGTDIAQVALVNGAARTRPEAPDSYREQEVAAQTARRGIWVNLPPPPETVAHPVVQDTATLAAGPKVFALDGIVGFAMPYSGQLQGYIAGAGDSMTCSPQGDPGHFVCLLPDNTDIAKVALVNGAARVAPDAPDAYRAQQLDALNNRRGYWATVSDSVRASAMVLEPQPEYVLAAGDDGVDGISYVGGAPMAMIDGASVFLVFGAGLGWGYYDHYHHWRGAPDRYRYHMEHFHPDGHGLRGFDRGVGYHDAALRAGEVHPGFHGGVPGAAEHAGAYGHPGAYEHAGVAGHPGAYEHAGVAAHPGAGAPMAHAAMGAPGAHPGNMAAGGARFGGPPGGGFMHPGAAASAGGFHPGVPGGAMHTAAAAPHVSAPAVRHK